MEFKTTDLIGYILKSPLLKYSQSNHVLSEQPFTRAKSPGGSGDENVTKSAAKAVQ